MKKRFLAVFLALALCLGLCAPALAAEDAPSPWQDAAFNDGVYEGYYVQLNDLQKMLYDKIKEAFAQPVQSAIIEFDEPILLEAEDGGPFTEEDKFQWMCDNMYNQYGGRYAVFRDHPELPWLLAVDYGARTLGEWVYDGQNVPVGYRMTGMYYENTYPWVPPEAYTDPSALEEGSDKAVAAIGGPRPSRAATLRAILDYLCGLTSYDILSGTMPDKDSGEAHTVRYDHTAYSVLASPNKGVCNAYSAAFKLLCDRYGIPCVHVSGAATGGNHAWNYVQLENGIWYAVDPTWSDGDTAVDYSYFLVGRESKNRSGTPFEDTHQVPAGNDGLPCPPLSDTAYPYLEAALGEVPETVEPGGVIQLELSGIRDLEGTVVTDGTAGLFEEDAHTAAVTGAIQDGSVSLRYDTAEAQLGPGRHRLYVKCTDGEKAGAILAAVEITLLSDEPAFTDVPDWCSAAVDWAVSQTITDGVGSNRFAPGNQCTNAMILTFLWRAAGEPGSSAALPVDITGKNLSYAETALRWAAEKGMIDKTLDPTAYCTRASAVTYIWQALGKDSAPASSFSDVSASAAYAPAVDWAVANGIVEGYPDGAFHPDTVCSRGVIVTMLHRAYVPSARLK